MKASKIETYSLFTTGCREKYHIQKNKIVLCCAIKAMARIQRIRQPIHEKKPIDCLGQRNDRYFPDAFSRLQ